VSASQDLSGGVPLALEDPESELVLVPGLRVAGSVLEERAQAKVKPSALTLILFRG
jgi:hypothetical protein